MPGTDDPANLAPASQTNAESSDSEDQFTDAQSAPRSPLPTSPKPDAPAEVANHESPSAPEASKVETSKDDDDDDDDDDELELENGSTTPGQDDSAPPKTLKDETPAIIVDEDAVPTPQPKEETAHSLADTQSALSSSHQVPSNDDEESTQDREESEEGEEEDEEEGDNDAFGDDFDDFEEGGGEDDFDDFEDGFQQPDPSHAQESAPPPPPVPQATLPFPIPDFDGESPDDVLAATEAYLSALFPPETLDVPQFPPLSKSTSAFTTPRSASLWSQLVAPPPLAPPDWIRSRTRRLFLVSLGVPVDLDEILPASKQKKLVLPSLNVPSSGSPRTSSDSRSVSRLRQGDANSSSASVDTQGKPRKRKGPPPQPELDMVAARHLCLTTDEALDGMTDEELKSHVAKLEGLQGAAKDVLEYWQKRTDEKIAERETFEGVIENLVKHARKVRK